MLPSLLSRDQEPHYRAVKLSLVTHSESQSEADGLRASGPRWGGVKSCFFHLNLP